jgi:hypothetical protein
MFFRFRSLAIPSMLFAAACAGGSTPSSPSDPGAPGDPGQPSTPVTPGAGGTTEQTATSLGLSIMSSNAQGAPRLIRSIVPRASAAGMTPEAAARDHLAALAPLWIQQSRPLAVIDAGTTRLRNGATVVRLAQHVDGVLVEQGELRVMLHSDDSLAAVSGTVLPSLAKPKFVSSAHEALGHALDLQFGTARPQVAITETGDAGDGWQGLAVAAAPQMQVTSARARRELAKVGEVYKEVWALEVDGQTAPDPLSETPAPTLSTYRILVADDGGKIISARNLTQNDAFVYRAYAETTGNRRPLDSPLADFTPHPTGFPDGSAPSLISSNLVVMEAFNETVDKWLPDNATSTSGNNAEAFADLDGNAVFSAGDIRAEVRGGRTLNYTYDHTAEPTATVNQSKASMVNSFFLVNWMHDWWYDSGFTEAAGNAQLDNYGRGGVAGDPLLITAQAGANAGLRNNADMSTPGDGARPRMRMFLWTAGTVTSLTTPTGAPRSESFSTGPRSFDLVGDLVLANDATAPFNDACQPITSNVAGKIALVTYSALCNSATMVNSVKAAGAIGVVLADGGLDDPRAFGGSAAANIPGVTVGMTDGAALVAAVTAGPVSVELSSGVSGPERDGDFDNTVVGHEWGHYLHHRLADCGAQQCSGMSEGWGDFNALMLVLRDGDNRDGVYGMAPYAIDNGTPNFAYFGLRRFPYSRDRSKNNLSFRDIGDENALPTNAPGNPGGANSEVHNTGEVWATMMWEVLNVLVDEHGVTVARRRMSDYVVAGLLLTPPDATFTEARDAILAAASALDTDDMILMAAAFAGRGAGSCAVSPDVNSPTNAGVVESGTLAGKLALSAITVIDDGISCDHDGYLDPGESGNLHVTIANNGILAAEQVTITATTTSAGVRLGTPLKIAALQPFSSAQLTVPVTVLSTAPRNATITISLHVTGDDTCDRTGITTTVSALTGVDDTLAVSKIDHADTKASPWTATGSATTVWGHAIDSTGNSAFFAKDSGFPSDTQFVSPALVASMTDPFVVSFKHSYNLEGAPGQLFDGGMLELSTDGGTTWSDVTAFGVNPGYSGPLFVGSDNPLAGRQAYSGVSPGFPALTPVALNFGTQFAGQSVLVRFRLGTDAAAAFTGWTIDDVAVSGITNTPFPLLVTEPSTCTARKAIDDQSSVVATQIAPAKSLAAFDAAACIARDAAR